MPTAGLRMAFQFHRAPRQVLGPNAASPRARVEERAVGRNVRARRELIVAARSSSGLARCGLPEFELLRGAEFFAGPLAAVAGESI